MGFERGFPLGERLRIRNWIAVQSHTILCIAILLRKVHDRKVCHRVTIPTYKDVDLALLLELVRRISQASGPDHVMGRLIERLNKLEGYEFEQLVARILDALGFRDTQVVGRSGDEGIDLITYLHSPLIRAKVVVQVKRHTANVGPKDVSYLRDRWSHRADRLMFVTTSDFTAGAKEVAYERETSQWN